MKERYLPIYMEMATSVAKLSYAIRKQVGCVIVSPDDLVVYGWNGMPSGWDNVCEEFDYYRINMMRMADLPIPEGMEPNIVTKKEVLHAESNALMKAAREGFKLKGGRMFLTCSPCIDCAKLIHQAGISEVYYKEKYRNIDGIEFLEKCGVKINHYE